MFFSYSLFIVEQDPSPIYFYPFPQAFSPSAIFPARGVTGRCFKERYVRGKELINVQVGKCPLREMPITES